MNCYNLQGIPRGCRDSAGGLRRVLIAVKSKVTSITPVQNVTATPADEGIITGITMKTPTDYFYEFRPTKTSSNATEEAEISLANGSVGFNQSINLVFSKREVSKRNAIKLLAAAEVIAIVEDQCGKYWMYGEINGMEVSSAKTDTGVNLGDLNGYNVTLAGTEFQLAREVDPVATNLDDLIAPEV